MPNTGAGEGDVGGAQRPELHPLRAQHPPLGDLQVGGQWHVWRGRGGPVRGAAMSVVIATLLSGVVDAATPPRPWVSSMNASSRDAGTRGQLDQRDGRGSRRALPMASLSGRPLRGGPVRGPVTLTSAPTSRSRSRPASGVRTPDHLAGGQFGEVAHGTGSAISLPRPITIRCSAVSGPSRSSGRRHDTVRPSAASARSSVRIQRMPSGSSPLTGSSSTRVAGSPSSAAATPSRWPNA